MENVDLLIKNVQVFNSYLKKFHKAHVSVLDGRIYYIDKNKDTVYNPKKTIEAQGLYMIPGFIDIHMHIESSMMTPQPFCEKLAQCGVTTIVSEPHEIANVGGLSAIKSMMEAGNQSIIDIFYGIPSSVPSTDSSLETTGGIISFEEMKELLHKDKMVCVGEVMNYREVIKENNLEITKFLHYLRKIHPNFVIEGHCPSLLDLELAKFLYLGINGDHTEHTLEEIKQRIENGMFIEIQEKMLRTEILHYIIENNLFEYCSFVTDDVMADTLYEEGHLNKVIQKAISMGFPLEQAIYCSSYTPSRRMNLRDRGSIAPGQLADFILLKDCKNLEIERVYKRGEKIFPINKEASKTDNTYKFPRKLYESINIKELSLEDFKITIPENVSSVKVKVMEVQEGTTHTKIEEVSMPVKSHILQWKNSGCLLAMVFERYGKNGNIGYGFVKGNAITQGTVATTYFHDHHNLFVLGEDEETMLLAVNTIKEIQGGMVTAKGGKILSLLPLPVGGILSDKSVQEVGQGLKKIRKSLIDLGYRHYNPIMSLCTLGLPVSPALKITDIGLIDVAKSKKVNLYEVE